MPKLTIPSFTTESAYFHPILGGGLGPYAYIALGDLAGLSQFGVHIEALAPGSRSSFRHWHETEDEMIYMLQGEVVLIEDSETLLQVGDAAAWPKGAGLAHCLENRSDTEARYLTIGTRNKVDVIHYPDHDLVAYKDGATRRYTKSDGTTHNANPTASQSKSCSTFPKEGPTQ